MLRFLCTGHEYLIPHLTLFVFLKVFLGFFHQAFHRAAWFALGLFTENFETMLQASHLILGDFEVGVEGILSVRCSITLS